MKWISFITVLIFLPGILLAEPKPLQAATPSIDKRLFAPSTKGEHNPHPGWFPGSLDEAGGPDAGGYIFTDSQEPSGPTFQWIDISGTGTPIVGMGDDDWRGPFPLPWNFTYYGTIYHEIYVCSNGFLKFGGGSTSYGNEPIPSGAMPNNILCLFWDDLNPTSGGTIYYGLDADSNWICQFQNIREYSGSGTITAEIILQNDGTISYQYQSLANGIDITGETIGVENAYGNIGLLVSLDNTPANYPMNQLAIRFQHIPANATVSGVVMDSVTHNPIDGATVRFGAIETETGPDGTYHINEIWAGTYDVRIFAYGFLDHRQDNIAIQQGTNTLDASLAPSGFPHGMVGLWTFDDPTHLTQATFGNNLVLVGSHSSIPGPIPGDGAARIGVGSFYRCYHDIMPNGALSPPQWVNQFTIVMDVRIPALSNWYCLYQTNYQNINDGDWFINPTGQVGVGVTGYSEYTLQPNEWYRLAISVSLGVHYDYYLDGQLLQIGGPQDYEGRFALYPANNANQVLFFADDNGEDGPIDVARVAIFDRDLSPAELDSMGGYGHEFPGPEISYMDPYLQSPTENSVYICWHSALSTESRVEYGTTESLGQSATGNSVLFNEQTIWHWVKLEDLDPETEYFYRCITDTAYSTIRAFQTPPPAGSRDSHVRFVVYSDPQTNASVHRTVVEAMEQTLIARFGEDYQREVQLVMLSGDIVGNGLNLPSYQTEFFGPTARISDAVPFMNAIGNHEAESPFYYDYMKYEDFAGAEGERYYSFVIGPVLFIALNGNIQGNTQLTWLQGVLNTAQSNEDIDWIFVAVHQPGRSEIWPDGNTGWVQNQVIPLLSQYSKVEQLSYGHTHAYERGAVTEGNLRLMCFGGGGGDLDRWRMYPNQTDYPEIYRANDYYGYTIFDIDCEHETYYATAYSLGNENVPMNNVLFDSWIRDHNSSPPMTPLALAPSGQGGFPMTLTASPFTGDYPIMSSYFQLTTTQGNWTNPAVDQKRDWEDVYFDTGPPNYTPIDRNAGIDLTRLNIPDGTLLLGDTVWWRLRFRDQDLLWSEWSEPASFVVTTIANNAEFTADITSGIAPLTVRFTDLSTNAPEGWSWDLDGDGNPDSQLRDPVWTYQNPGTYTISLTVDYGTEHLTETKQNYITVQPNLVANRLHTPTEFALFQNHPNPFNAGTMIEYSLPVPSEIEMRIYNIQGRLVREFNANHRTSGYYSVYWDGRDRGGHPVASGIYFYQLKTSAFIKSLKAILLK
jgi:hypothetical protein